MLEFLPKAKCIMASTCVTSASALAATEIHGLLIPLSFLFGYVWTLVPVPPFSTNGHPLGIGQRRGRKGHFIQKGKISLDSAGNKGKQGDTVEIRVTSGLGLQISPADP